MARLYDRWKRPREALHALEQASLNGDLVIGQVFWSGSERQRALCLRDLVHTLYEYVGLVARHFSDDPLVVRRAFDMLLRRKAISAEALAVQRDAVLRGRYPDLQPAFDALKRTRAEIARLMLEGPGDGGKGHHEERLAELEAERERLESTLAQGIPDLKLEESFRTADADAVSQVIPVGHALIEFVRCPLLPFPTTVRELTAENPQHYLAFILPAANAIRLAMVDLGRAEEVDRRLDDVRKGIHSARAARDLPSAEPPADFDHEAAAQLRALVFDPLVSHLGTCRDLILAPDGNLTRLPFEILPTADGKRLIDSWHFSYVSVGRDLLRLTRSASRIHGGAVVVADPNYDLAAPPAAAGPTDSLTEGKSPGVLLPAGMTTRPGGAQSGSPKLRGELGRACLSFGKLPNTRLEARDVGAILGVGAHTGDDATVGLIRSCRSPWILHLATHGFFLESACQAASAVANPQPMPERFIESDLGNPLLRSGVALAGANTWLRDLPLPAHAGCGLLTAEDVVGLDLLDTELVVLSACETGLGEEDFSEGIMGLRRSFALAGARTVVMSLWKVPDAETRELMVEFYRRLRSGVGRAEALRQAQLRVREEHPEVFWWGAFICLGDPGPLY